MKQLQIDMDTAFKLDIRNANMLPFDAYFVR